MTNTQRMESDKATANRREIADKTKSENRMRNDELTVERRSKIDSTKSYNRMRNDELTANRREIKDGNSSLFLAIALWALVILAVVFFFIFI